MSFSFSFPYTPHPDFQKRIGYFCMEFAIHQPLKLYAGGLGFLAGSHLRSAYDLRQNMVGIGILWKYGYYDQVRKQDQAMYVLFQEKVYGFLIKTDIKFKIIISGHAVWVTAYYLAPEIFHTAPAFFLSTDIPENDYLSKTICHRLYDSNPETKIAASILLGHGGAKLLEVINWQPDIYHMNESHGLPLAFYLYKKYAEVKEVEKRLRFTNHTPEPGGNEKTNPFLLQKFGYFNDVPIEEVRKLSIIENELLDHTATAIRMSGRVNAVSQLHKETLSHMRKQTGSSKELISITNAQHFAYWADEEMYKAMNKNDDQAFAQRKKKCKQVLFEEVADQNGEILDENVLTIVFAKRFGGYKRPELLLDNMDRFHRLITNSSYPVQIIWAGKPYPMDFSAIALFDRIVNICKTYPNCSILTGYEMNLSRLLKQGADIWLNVPRITHEACGTSGMSAVMNGAVNVSIADGWFPEFVKDKINGFVIPASSPDLPVHQQDEADANTLYDLLESEVIPMYYDNPEKWLAIIKNGMRDITPQFDSNRMVKDYYERLYVDV